MDYSVQNDIVTALALQRNGIILANISAYGAVTYHVLLYLIV